MTVLLCVETGDSNVEVILSSVASVFRVLLHESFSWFPGPGWPVQRDVHVVLLGGSGGGEREETKERKPNGKGHKKEGNTTEGLAQFLPSNRLVCIHIPYGKELFLTLRLLSF